MPLTTAARSQTVGTLAARTLAATSLSLAVAATACAAPGKPPSASPAEPRVPPSSARIAYRELPIDLCIALDRKTAKALDSGDARLLLHLQNQTFARRYSPPFGVAVYTNRAHGRLGPWQTLSMQIDIPSREDPAVPVAQRFAVDVDGLRLAARAPGPLCVALRLDTDPQLAHMRPQDRLSAGLSFERPSP